MKVLIGVLYVFTALAACYWAIYLVLTGLYGVTFSFWSVSLLSGAIVLLAGAIMGWDDSGSLGALVARNRRWSHCGIFRTCIHDDFDSGACIGFKTTDPSTD